MTCEEFEELSGAYVLNSVTVAERQVAEAHLATCVKCTHLLQELRGVVTLLPLSVPQVNPSPALKERILAALRQESMRTNRQTTRLGRRQRWSLRVLAAAAVFMFCLLGGMTAWNVSLHAQAASLQQQLTNVSSHRLSTVVTYTVKGTAGVKGATGQLFYFAQQNITVLIIYGLPQPQGVHVYQGWLLRLNGTNIIGVTSIGLLNVEHGSASLSFPGNVTGYDAAAISIEPGPTATISAPKGKVIALGSLKRSR
jgi:anti-sigma-K factor RskA